MKEIIFVTTNQGKIESANKALDGIRVLPFNAELIEPRGDDIKLIAKEKVKQAFKITNKPCIALDAGFFIEAWNGFPKAYVNHTLETLKLEGILKLMENIENRKCEFRQCLAYYDGVNLETFESTSPGTMSEEIKGNDTAKKWSELWYIFKPLDFDKTLAELSEDEFIDYYKKAKPSSMKKFGKWFKTI